jgi:hypothetical protein
MSNSEKRLQWLCHVKRSGQNENTTKGIIITFCEKETHWMIQKRTVQSDRPTGRLSEERGKIEETFYSSSHTDQYRKRCKNWGGRGNSVWKFGGEISWRTLRWWKLREVCCDHWWQMGLTQEHVQRRRLVLAVLNLRIMPPASFISMLSQSCYDAVVWTNNEVSPVSVDQ